MQTQHDDDEDMAAPPTELNAMPSLVALQEPTEPGMPGNAAPPASQDGGARTVTTVRSHRGGGMRRRIQGRPAQPAPRASTPQELNNPNQRPSITARFQATAMVISDDSEDDIDLDTAVTAAPRTEEQMKEFERAQRQQGKQVRVIRRAPASLTASRPAPDAASVLPPPPPSSQDAVQQQYRVAADAEDDDGLLDMDGAFASTIPHQQRKAAPDNQALSMSSTHSTKSMVESRLAAAQLVMDDPDSSKRRPVSRTSAATADTDAKRRELDAAVAANTALLPGAVAVAGPDFAALSPGNSVGSTSSRSMRMDHAGEIQETQHDESNDERLSSARISGRSNVIRIRGTRTPRDDNSIISGAYPQQQAKTDAAKQPEQKQIAPTTALRAPPESMGLAKQRAQAGRGQGVPRGRPSSIDDDDDDTLTFITDDVPQITLSQHMSTGTANEVTRSAHPNAKMTQAPANDDHEEVVEPGAYAVEGVDGAVDDADYEMYGINEENWDEDRTLTTEQAMGGSVADGRRNTDAVSMLGVSSHHAHQSIADQSIGDAELGHTTEHSRPTVPAYLASQPQVVRPGIDEALDNASKHSVRKDEDPAPGRKKTVIFGTIGVICLIIVIVVVVVIAVSAGGSSGGGNETQGPTQAPTTPRDSPRRQELERILTPILGQPDQLDNAASIEYTAVAWMTDNDEIILIDDAAKIRVRFALLMFFFNLDDALVTDFLGTQDECSWVYVTCTDGVVTAINADEKGLKGSIPVEFRELSTLNKLSLLLNKINGTIGEQIATMSNLTDLTVAANELTEVQFDKLPSGIVHILVSQNELTGFDTTQLKRLESLETLRMVQNELTTPLKDIILQLPESIKDFRFSSNKIGGTIPTEIGNLVNLELLEGESTRVAGRLPAEIGSLSKVTSMNLRGNSLTGPIPPEIGDMHELQHLRLFTNQFNETVPAELANLTRLESIHIRDNRLSGRIPTEMGLLSNTLIAMDFSQNAFTGSIPSELGQLTLLNQLSLYFNDLEGVVPTELAELVNVGLLYLASTFITEVPAAMCNAPQFVKITVPQGALCPCPSCEFAR